MQALRKKECLNFWSATGAYEAVAQYIDMNYNGLKDDIINLLCGGRALVDVDDFQNDLRTIDNKDNVLTVLIHLGYLSYDSKRHECYIPNLEVGEEMTSIVAEYTGELLLVGNNYDKMSKSHTCKIETWQK